MALKNELDPEHARNVLAPWLAQHLGATGDSVDIGEVEVPHASGLSSETLLFDATWQVDGKTFRGSFVARVAPEGDGMFMEYNLQREALVMNALAEHTTIAAPRIRAVSTDPSLLGAPFLIMDRCYGRVPPDDPPFTASGWVLELTPEERAALVDKALEAIAEIHQVDWRAVGLESLGRNESGDTPLEREIAYFEKFYEWGSRGQHSPTIDAGLQWARENRPTAEADPVVVWGDARIGNMMFGPDLAVTGVFDWEMVTLGPAGQDLGWFVFMNRLFSEEFGFPLPEGIPDQRGTLERYEQLSGTTVADFDFYVGWAAVRAGIIYARVGHLMIELGLQPADSQMWLSNPASNLLARILDLPAPAVASSGWVTGKR